MDYRTLILAGAVLCLASSSCTTEPLPTKTITLSLSGLPSAPITRGVEDALAATLPPTSASVHIVSKTKSARTYDAVIGTPVTLAYDSYTASGEWKPSAPKGYILGGVYYALPPYLVGGEFTVSESDATYLLPATWDCAALVVRPSELSSLMISAASSGYDDILSDFGSGEYGVVYVSGTWNAKYPLTVKANPKDDVNYEPLEVKFTSATLRKGYWYLLSPSAVEVTGGALGVDFPSWNNE